LFEIGYDVFYLTQIEKIVFFFIHLIHFCIKYPILIFGFFEIFFESKCNLRGEAVGMIDSKYQDLRHKIFLIKSGSISMTSKY
jgi:hypothetical protein